jgi:hypothetical protein
MPTKKIDVGDQPAEAQDKEKRIYEGAYFVRIEHLFEGIVHGLAVRTGHEHHGDGNDSQTDNDNGICKNDKGGKRNDVQIAGERQKAGIHNKKLCVAGTPCFGKIENQTDTHRDTEVSDIKDKINLKSMKNNEIRIETCAGQQTEDEIPVFDDTFLKIGKRGPDSQNDQQRQERKRYG